MSRSGKRSVEGPALELLRQNLHGTDLSDDRDATLQSRGLLAIAEGFYLQSPAVSDALYTWYGRETSSTP